MSKIFIKNAVIVTMDDEQPLIKKGAVGITDDLICAVGSYEEVAKDFSDAQKVIDAEGMLLMPGLVDLHYHTSFSKGFYEEKPLDACLFDYWYPMIRNITPEETYWTALYSYGESIRYGTTTVNDMFRNMISCAEAAEKIGIRATLCSDVANDEEGLDTYEDNIRLYKEKNGAANGRIDVAFGYEWMPVGGPDLLKELKACSDEYNAKIHIHLNESEDEVKESIRLFGRRPAELAWDCGVLTDHTIAAHCVHLSHQEVALMAETKTSISHNPVSNSLLGNGVAQVPELMARGINVGFGHDDLMSSLNRDMFSIMKYASLMQRAASADANLLLSPEVLKMATVNGNKALCHNGGMIKAGMKADMILLNLRNEHFVPLVLDENTNVFSHLVYSASGADVDTSIIDGTVVMENRKLIFVDEQEVWARVNEIYAKTLKRLQSE